MKTAEIIAIGSELLTSYRTDTNSLWLTEQLNSYGISVTRKQIVADDQSTLAKTFLESGHRADLVIATGGLGPTFDDITREALAEALDLELVYKDRIVRKMFEVIMQRRNLKITENNRKQGFVPLGAKYVLNPVGTAPGILLPNKLATFVLLPGPPSEMKGVWGRLQKHLFRHSASQTVFTRKYKLVNIPESKAETMLIDIPLPEQADWSILATYGQVEIHLHIKTSSKEAAETMFDEFADQMRLRIGQHLFGTDNEELEDVVGRLLAENNHTISLAESCTGGMLAQRLTNVSGSSRYFQQAVITYSNDAKVQQLGVSNKDMEEHGAVSSFIAREMAAKIRAKSSSDVGIGITGIAGPTGGTEDKPVGTVYIAVAAADGTLSCYRFLFLGDREKIRYQATQAALDMVRVKYLGFELESSFIVNKPSGD
jgi:nicotinamide-nucleotide amidase